ncbi:MAG: hypothetical protein JO180_02340 [Gemmatirosa sp.]|nr:hypothetical protein [Gemmatirosa sp.]
MPSRRRALVTSIVAAAAVGALACKPKVQPNDSTGVDGSPTKAVVQPAPNDSTGVDGSPHAASTVAPNDSTGVDGSPAGSKAYPAPIKRDTVRHVPTKKP